MATALAEPQIVESVYVNTADNSSWTQTNYIITPMPTFATTSVVTQIAFSSLNSTKGPLPYPDPVITPPPASITIPLGPSSTAVVTSSTAVVYWKAYQVDHYKLSTQYDGGVACHTSRSVHELPSPYIMNYNGSDPDGQLRVTGQIPAGFLSAIGSTNATAGRWSAEPTLIVVEQEVCAAVTSRPLFDASTSGFRSMTYASLSNGLPLPTFATLSFAFSSVGVLTSETILQGPSIAASVFLETTETSFMVPTQTPTVLRITTQQGDVQIPMGITTTGPPYTTPTVLPNIIGSDGNTGPSQSSGTRTGGKQPGSNADASQGSDTQLGGTEFSQPASGSGSFSRPANEDGSSGTTQSNQDTGPDLGSIIAGVIGAAHSEPSPATGTVSSSGSSSQIEQGQFAGSSGQQEQMSGGLTSSNSGHSASSENSNSDQTSQIQQSSGSSAKPATQNQQPGDFDEPNSSTPAISPVVRIGSIQITQQAVPVLQVGTSTLYPGSSAEFFTANGNTIAAATNGVVVNGQTSTIAVPSSAQRITAGGQGVLIQPTPAFMIEGQAVVAGGPARTIDGTVYSLAPSGTALVIAGSTMAISQPPAQTNSAARLLSIGSNIFTANSFAEFIVGSQTLVPGGPALTLPGGTVVSLPTPGTAAIIGKQTQILGSAVTPAPLFTLTGTIYKPNSGMTFYVNNQALVPGSSINDHGTTISLSGVSTVIVNGIPTTLTFTTPTTNPAVPTITAPPLLTINNALITALVSSHPSYTISSQVLTPGGTITISSPNGPETLVLSPDLESLTVIVAGTTATSALDEYYIHTPSILPPILSFSSFPTALAFSNFPLASSTFFALPGTATAYLLPALTGNGKQTLLPKGTATEAAQGTTFLVILGGGAAELTVEAVDSTGAVIAMTSTRLWPASVTVATTTPSVSGTTSRTGLGSDPGSVGGSSGLGAAATSAGAGKDVKGVASSPRVDRFGAWSAGLAAFVFGLAVIL